MLKNLRKNWDNGYDSKVPTYTEILKNPSDVEQMWNYKVIHDYIVSNLPNVKNSKIIEVGCGGARNALYLALHGFDVTCSDYSEEGLSLAKTNFAAFNAKGSFLQDDLMNSNIPDNSFDCVMSFGLLEHFSELKPIIDNITRLIKPGGIHIHLIIPKKFSTQTIMNILMFPIKLIYNILRRQPLRGILKRSYRNFPHYENSFSLREYCDAFEKNGNKVIKSDLGGLLIPFTNNLKYIGLGHFFIKLFQKQIIKINNKVKNSKSPLIYHLSQTFTIVSRKN